MSQGKRRAPEQIINCMREAEVLLSQGHTVPDVCKRLAVSTQSYYRWRKEYGGLKSNQAKRLKDLEKENTRLRRVVSDLTLDKMNLREAAQGNF
jgi:transposase-like protein